MRHLAEIFRFSGDRLERTWQARHQVLHLPNKGRKKREYLKRRFWCLATNAVCASKCSIFCPGAVCVKCAGMPSFGVGGNVSAVAEARSYSKESSRVL